MKILVTGPDHVYNVGSEEMNYNKEDVALLDQAEDRLLPFAEIGKDEEQRNYEAAIGAPAC